MLKIGLLVDSLSHWYQHGLLRGAHEESVRADASLYCLSGGEIEIHRQRNSIYELIGPRDFDAIVVSSGTITRTPTTLELTGFFTRFAPTPLTSISVEVDSVPSVVVDNAGGIRELTLHLIDRHDRRRIAFTRVANPEGEQRFAGYRQALEERGLPLDPELVVDATFTTEAGEAAVEVLFEQRKVACDAIVAASDWIAIGALRALSRRGLRVPEDVALTGFDDIDEARFSLPTITSVHQPVRELGATALRLALDRLRGRDVPLVTRVRTRTSYRESCGCAGVDWSQGDAQSVVEGGLEAIERSREALGLELAEGVGDVHGALPPDWAVSFVDALLADLRRGSRDQLAPALRGLLSRVRHLKDVHVWQGFVSTLRSRMAPHLAVDRELSRRAHLLHDEARLIVAAEAERVQGRLRWEKDHLMLVLNELSAELRDAFDQAAATQTLAHHLSRLDVPSCFVALQPEGRSADAEARLILAYDGGAPLKLSTHEQTFRSGDLVPRELRGDRRRTMIVEPLWLGDDAGGFCVLELGAASGLVYEAIREQLGSAFRAARLLEARIEETTRREKAERARLESEMRLAQRIQTSMLPRQKLVNGFEIATEMQPAAEVGGDYFDVLACQDGCWVGIGDVAGHGLDTGLITLMIQGIVGGATCQRPEAPARLIWRIVNAMLYENVRLRLERDEHATLMLLRCRKNGHVSYVGAHEDLLVFRRESGRVELLPSSGIWAGVSSDVEEGQVDERELRLWPGDALLLYTDGITEAMNADQQRFGLERLQQTFESIGHRPVEDIREHIAHAVQLWAPELIDDRTLVLLRYVGETATGGRPKAPM